MTTLRCATCLHWAALDRSSSFAAPCALGVYTGRVAFDQGCDRHSSAPQPQPATPPIFPVPMFAWGMKKP